eukprot:749343-Hanusia_phi.AAC.9
MCLRLNTESGPDRRRVPVQPQGQARPGSLHGRPGIPKLTVGHLSGARGSFQENQESSPCICSTCTCGADGSDWHCQVKKRQ